MSEVAVRHGGGGGSVYAAISVTYPEGSVCTCTDGVKTLTAKDTSGKYIFLLPGAGAWTVSCTDGIARAAVSVEPGERYSHESVTLSYETVLFENGELSPLLGSLRNISLDTYKLADGVIRCVESGSNTGTSKGYGSFSLPIDLTGRTALCIETEADAYGTNQCFGVATRGTTTFVASANKTRNGSELLTIPVDKLSGTYDIVFAVWAYGDYSTGALTTSVKVSGIRLI